MKIRIHTLTESVPTKDTQGRSSITNSEEKHVSLISRRKLLLNGVLATAGVSLIGEAAAQETTDGSQPGKAFDSSITLQIYKGFSQNRLDLWDAVIHPDVKSDSPAGRNIDGITALKRWNQSFIDAFHPRTDLVDHFVAEDRGLVAINLHWILKMVSFPCNSDGAISSGALAGHLLSCTPQGGLWQMDTPSVRARSLAT